MRKRFLEIYSRAAFMRLSSTSMIIMEVRLLGEAFDIIVKDLVKKYDKIVALRGISLTVRRGEIFGLLEPNGAGKTTLIHILATLIKPTSGSAVVAGHDVTKEPDAVRKNIGIVFQEPSLALNLTGYENLYIHGKLYGLRGKELKERIEEVLRFVDLYEHKDRVVKNYSGGMKRRLEIARALLHEPKVLFLDEPTLGLDPQIRARIWEYIKKLNREKGVTIFLTTHYIEEAEALCGRIAIIDQGKIIAVGNPEELKSIVGSDVLYVNADAHEVEICRILKIMGFHDCIPIGKGRVMLRVKKATEAVPDIVRALEYHGITVKEVSYRKPSLNEVFLCLVGHEIVEEKVGSMKHFRGFMR